MHKAPLWLMKATLPGRAMAPARLALIPVSGDITPREFGPMIRNPPRRGHDLLLETESLSPALSEAGGENDGTLDPNGGALGNGAGDCRSGTCYDSQLDMLRNSRDARVCLDSQNCCGFGIYGRNGAAEWARDQIPQHRAAFAPGCFICPDDRYRLWSEKHREGMVR